jgi:hypothetical protein
MDDELPPPPVEEEVVKRERKEAALLCNSTELASSHRDFSVCSCTYCDEEACRCVFDSRLSVML